MARAAVYYLLVLEDQLVAKVNTSGCIRDLRVVVGGPILVAEKLRGAEAW